MLFLTLETSCDETAAAILTDKLEVRSAVVASQDKLHQRFGGVVPEIASRAHVERILPVVDEAFRRAEITPQEIDAIAVVTTPGLSGSLLIGLAAAKTLAVALGKPLVQVNHLQAHIYACRLSSGENIFPCLGLIVSGGHSNLYRCDGPTDFTLIGSTIDDAAGEAFDKVASMLGLPYPGGPSIEKAARTGNSKRFAFPRPMLDDKSKLQFSFSGLKTAVRYQLAGPGKPDFSAAQMDPQTVSDCAASFQEAVIDCLVGKSRLAMQKLGMKTLCVGGGVAANSRFRARMEEMATEEGIRLIVPPLSLCTDNAVMAAIAIERFKAGELADLSLDISPGLVR